MSADWVYTAAYVPDSGETINSLSVGYAPGTFLAHLVVTPSSFPFATVDPQFYAEDFAQDFNPKLGAEITAEQRPTSLFLFGTPSGPGAWHTLPSWYAVSGHDLAIDPALERFMAQRAGSTTVEVRRREPRGRPHALLDTLREADRTSDRRDLDE